MYSYGFGIWVAWIHTDSTEYIWFRMLYACMYANLCIRMYFATPISGCHKLISGSIHMVSHVCTDVGHGIAWIGMFSHGICLKFQFIRFGNSLFFARFHIRVFHVCSCVFV